MTFFGGADDFDLFVHEKLSPPTESTTDGVETLGRGGMYYFGGPDGNDWLTFPLANSVTAQKLEDVVELDASPACVGSPGPFMRTLVRCLRCLFLTPPSITLDAADCEEVPEAELQNL